MRTTPFRTILHAVAYKLGLDPDQDNFLTNQAIPIGTYINQWVDREYSAKDWPEWTITQQFSPDANHIVPWSAISSQSGNRMEIGRVLKVYLVDPITTDAPIDTHYTLRDIGIHCGFDHGTHVWIRYLAPCPIFTAEQWDAARIYKAQDVTYSYSTGECYRSKVSGNIGHDPSFTFSPPPLGQVEQEPIELNTEVIVPLVQGNPGVSAQDQIVDVIFVTGGGGGPIPNPPPLNTRFFVEVVDVNGALVGNATSVANGTDTLDQIVTDLSNQLIVALTGFTSVTVDMFTIHIEDNSNFRVNQAFWGLFAQPNRNVPVLQIQSYIPAVPATDGKPQVIQFPLSSNTDQVTPGATYLLDFRDITGVVHRVIYVSQTTDDAVQILSGLITQLQIAAQSDTFLQTVSATLDTVSPSDLFATPTAISINASMLLPGSPWWELVPFPSTIQNQVIRGAYADLLKEWSQTDKGMAEEGRTTDETAVAEDKFEITRNPQLTGQQTALSRYKL